MIVKGKITKLRMSALDYFADILLTKQMSRHIIVTVTFRKKMDHLGLTTVEDYNLSGKPREFVLDIHRNQIEEEIIRTLAHEMVHVKQLVYHETNDELSVWKGKRVNSDLLDYWHHPWEIEAYGCEVGLFTTFAIKENLWDVLRNISNPNETILWEEIGCSIFIASITNKRSP